MKSTRNGITTYKTSEEITKDGFNVDALLKENRICLDLKTGRLYIKKECVMAKSVKEGGRTMKKQMEQFKNQTIIETKDFIHLFL